MSGSAKFSPLDARAQRKAVIAVASRGDREAFAALFRHFAPKVKAWAIAAGDPPSLAEELAQETLLRLWRRADRFDPARANVAGWLFAIARNARVDRARKARRLARGDAAIEIEEANAASAESETLRDERARIVRAALKKLPAEQSTVVRLAYFAQKTHGEIAQELDLPLGTVKSRLRLALRRLRAAEPSG